MRALFQDVPIDIRSEPNTTGVKGYKGTEFNEGERVTTATTMIIDKASKAKRSIRIHEMFRDKDSSFKGIPASFGSMNPGLADNDPAIMKPYLISSSSPRS